MERFAGHHCVSSRRCGWKTPVLIAFTGRDETFLNDLRDHAMSIFAGAMLINASPKPLKPVTGLLVGSNCWYLRRKALRGCLPFVKERLDNTARLKADPKCDWIPPVGTFPCTVHSGLRHLFLRPPPSTEQYSNFDAKCSKDFTDLRNRKTAFNGLSTNATQLPPKGMLVNLIPNVLHIGCF